MAKVSAKRSIAPSPICIERAVLDLSLSTIFEGGIVCKVNFFRVLEHSSFDRSLPDSP